MGTMIQGYRLDESRLSRRALRVLAARPQGQQRPAGADAARRSIAEIHRAYLEAGADIIETNTFTANYPSQADYRAEELGARAQPRGGAARAPGGGRIHARRPARCASWPARSVRPTARRRCRRTSTIRRSATSTSTSSRRPTSIGARALIEGGVDLLLIETIFDTLNAKAAIFAVRQAHRRGRASTCRSSSPARSPMPRAARCRARRPRRSGTRCATRGRSRSGSTARSARSSCVRTSRSCRASPMTYVSAYPNAGLPNAFGEYDEAPGETAELLREFAHQRLREHRRRLLRHDARAHPPHRARPSRALPPRKPPQLERRCRLSGLEPLNIGAGQPVRERRRAHQRHRLGEVPPADRGRRLQRRARRRAPAGGERRADHRRQHGRGHARFGSAPWCAS